MTAGVLLALTGPVESDLVRALDAPGSGVRVVRRCADVAEVLAAAAAGLGAIAVVGTDLAGVDRSVVRRLHDSGARVLLVAAPDDLHRAGALGADAVEPAGVAAATLADAVAAVVGDGTSRGRHLTRGARPTAPEEDAPRPVEDVPARQGGPEAPPPPPPPADDGRASDDVGTGADGGEETRPPQTRGQLVVVWGPPGAPGRTTLAVTLASELAGLASRSLLVDADTEAPSVTQVLGILDDASAVASVSRLALSGRLDPTALLRACPLVDGSMHVMTGLTRADRWRELPAAALEVVWDVARAAVPWTVVDTGSTLPEADGSGFGPSRHEATASALAAADVVVVVGSGDPVGMRRLVMALGDLGEADLMATAKRFVVVNRVRSTAAGRAPAQAVHEALSRFAGVSDAVLVPEDRAALDKAVMQGRALPQVVPGSPARTEIERLARRLAGERPRSRRRRLARVRG
ncbi:AAA family ATPase [Georgenia alba]|uniref:CpaE family protein n=1 Tax=Georgenia alba TaxID=2233858 RepID=A0ABW2QA24_9MICO